MFPVQQHNKGRQPCAHACSKALHMQAHTTAWGARVQSSAFHTVTASLQPKLATEHSHGIYVGGTYLGECDYS